MRKIMSMSSSAQKFLDKVTYEAICTASPDIDILREKFPGVSFEEEGIHIRVYADPPTLKAWMDFNFTDCREEVNHHILGAQKVPWMYADDPAYIEAIRTARPAGNNFGPGVYLRGDTLFGVC